MAGPLPRRLWLWALGICFFLGTFLGAFFLPQWIAPPKADAYLPISIHSQDEADYSVDLVPHLVPVVGLEILRSVIRYADPEATDFPERLATLTTILLTPVPTATSSESPALPGPPALPSASASHTAIPAGTIWTTETPIATWNATHTVTPPNHTAVPTYTPTDPPTPTSTSTGTPIPTTILTDTPTPTTLSPSAIPDCSAPLPVNGTLPDGFVQNVNPADGAMDVSLSLNTLTVYFNQPMWTGSGGGNVTRRRNYKLQAVMGNDSVSMLSFSYNPTTYALSITIDNNDPDWANGLLYEITIEDMVKNGCETMQGDNVSTSFTTVP